jgi:glycolate oxidase iron-sulfur subunit
MRSLLTRLVFRLIVPHRRLYNLLVRLARWAQKLMPRRGGGLRHMPLVFEGKRGIPELAKRPALSQLPESSGSGPRVAFFLGCLLNYAYPATASNAVKLLTRAGFEVVVPPGQVCCGLAALYMGDSKAAEKLARRNAAVFSRSGAEYVVTACATCATMIKQEYPRVLGSGWAGGAKVMEICEFLGTCGYKPQGRAEPVTYHDPCHMRFAQHVVREPRDLLSAVAELREPSEAGRCCGAGGTFSIFHYELSREIGQKEAKLLKDTGVKTVATACPGCIIQLADILGSDMQVCHVVDFIVRAGEQGNYVKQDDFVATESRPVPS